jgi:hypothetical protein
MCSATFIQDSSVVRYSFFAAFPRIREAYGSALITPNRPL